VDGTVTIADDETPPAQAAQVVVHCPKGRERIRERVAVEHRLASPGTADKAGGARYRGVRKNLFRCQAGGKQCITWKSSTAASLQPSRFQEGRVII